MIEKHYKSDFEFTEVHDESILLAPFTFTYYIEGNRSQLVVAYDGTTFHNCRYENGRLIIAYKGGTLGMGAVSVIRQFFLDNDNFKDGKCNVYSAEATDLYLGDGYTDYEGDVVMEFFPYYQQGKAGKDAYQEWLDLGNTGTVQDFLDSLRGESLKYEDLTEEQKQDLAFHLAIPNGSITEDKLSEEVKEQLGKGYEPPIGGIPLTDLSANVQASLGKADTAVQEYQLYNKQDKLVSGKNIATINGQSLLNGGNITITGGSGNADLSDYYTKEQVDTKIPTKTSQLTNDSGFLTEHQSLADYAKKSDIPTKTSELENDAQYVTQEGVRAAIQQAVLNEIHSDL